MTVHEIEQKYNVTKKTLIYYENEGLLKPGRDHNNYRHYSYDDMTRLKYILLLRSMDISINEIKQILNEELSIADVLKDKKELIKQQHLKLEDIDKKINEFIKRRKVKVSLNQDQEDKDTIDYLFFNQETIKYNDVIIPYQDIQCIKLSMSSAIGHARGLISVFMNYYVDLDIVVALHTYSFQIMNNEQVASMMEILKEKNIKTEDPLNLMNIYLEKRDLVALNNYINRNFRKWAKQYHLDNPRENYLINKHCD